MAEHDDGACDGCMFELNDLEPECYCEYPHGHDFDPYNFERCTCDEDCYHVTPLFLDRFPVKEDD